MKFITARNSDLSFHPKNIISKPPKWFVYGILCLCLLSLGARWMMTERLPFIMDELVDAQIGYQVGKGVDIYSELEWERTPLMTFLIGIITKSSTTSINAAISARKLMWFGTAIIFLLTYLIARQTNDRYTAVLTLLLLCGFTTFLDRSIRVRADLVSTLFSLPALWSVVTPSLHPLFLVIAGFFLSLAVLTTQKAVYFVIAFAIALVGRQIILSDLNVQSLKKVSLNSSIAIIGFAVPTLSFLLWVHFSGRMEQFLEQCVFRAANVGFVADTYSYTWKYFLQTVLRNPAIWCFGIVGIYLLVFSGIRNKKSQLSPKKKDEINGPGIALSLWTLSMFVLTLQHTVKFPYFYLNIAPSLAVCASVSLGRLKFYGSDQRLNLMRMVSIPLIFYLLFIGPVFHHKKNLTTDLIQVQSAIMNRVDSITTPTDTVFDGIGIAVTRRKATPYSLTARWFDERRMGANYDIFEVLRKSQPKVLIWNYRINRLNEDERAFLDTHFVPDWANVYVVGATVTHRESAHTKKTINLLSSAEYFVLSKDRQKIRIDGRVPGRVEFLTAGDHEVIISGEEQTLLLKYSPAVNVPAPPPENISRLFPSYSE